MKKILALIISGCLLLSACGNYTAKERKELLGDVEFYLSMYEAKGSAEEEIISRVSEMIELRLLDYNGEDKNTFNIIVDLIEMGRFDEVYEHYLKLGGDRTFFKPKVSQ